MYKKLGLLKDQLSKFEALMQVPDGAITPSLRAVFILVEKYLLNLQTHIAPLNSRFYHPSIFFKIYIEYDFGIMIVF